jgi:hypothetical protein
MRIYKLQNLKIDMFSINKNVSIFSLAQEYSEIQKAKSQIYKQINNNFSVKTSVKDIYNIFEKEKKLIDKKITKLINSIDIGNFLSEHGDDFGGKDDMIYFLRYLKTSLPELSKSYEIFLSQFKLEYLNKSNINELKHFSAEQVKKLRNKIKIDLQNFKNKLSEKFNGLELNNNLKKITSKEYLEHIINTNIELFNIKLNTFLKNSGQEMVNLIPGQITANIALYLTSKGLQKAEIDDLTVINLVSLISINLVFYSTSFIKIYMSNVNKYKNDTSLFIQECTTFFLTLIPIGIFVASPIFIFFNSLHKTNLDLGQDMNLVSANIITGIIITLCASPILLTVKHIKETIKLKLKLFTSNINKQT